LENLNFKLEEKNNYNNFFKNTSNIEDNKIKKIPLESNIRLRNEEINNKSNVDINIRKQSGIKTTTLGKRFETGNFKTNSISSAPDLLKLKNKAQVKIGFCLFLKSALCTLKTNSDILKNKIFLFMTDFYNERIDLMYYLETLNNLDKLKKLFLNDIHRKSLEICIKPDVLNEEQLKQLGYLKKENNELLEIQIIQYFKNKREKNSLETLDNKFLDIFPKYMIDQIKIDKEIKDALESAY